MINDILNLLASLSPKDRSRGWMQAWENRAELRGIAPEHKERLLKHYLEKKDVRLLQLATAVLVTVIPDALPAPPAPRPANLLADWLWAPFQAQSIVFSTTEPKPYRRDERAEFCVARRLGYQTKFERVLLGGSEWQESLSETPYQAACFIGRFGLYGDVAPRRLVNKQARLEFPEQFRPSNLQPNEIDDGFYHCIFERVGSNQVDKYRTKVDGGTRTDYALVQRYRRTLNDLKTIVVNLAGCTSLGTYAAAYWAAEKLFQPIDSTGKCLEVPHGIREDCVFEALLKVTASGAAAGAGNVLEIERLRLYVDHRCWSPETLSWEEVQIGEICLLTRSNGKSVFLLDGRPARLRPNHTYWCLLTAMMKQKLRTGNEEIDLAELAGDTSIWKQKGGGVQMVTVEKVYEVLKNLRSLHLHSALTVRKDRAWLHPEVRFEGPEPNRPLTTK